MLEQYSFFYNIWLIEITSVGVILSRLLSWEFFEEEIALKELVESNCFEFPSFPIPTVESQLFRSVEWIFNLSQGNNFMDSISWTGICTTYIIETVSWILWTHRSVLCFSGWIKPTICWRIYFLWLDFTHAVYSKDRRLHQWGKSCFFKHICLQSLFMEDSHLESLPLLFPFCFFFLFHPVFFMVSYK